MRGSALLNLLPPFSLRLKKSLPRLVQKRGGSGGYQPENKEKNPL